MSTAVAKHKRSTEEGNGITLKLSNKLTEEMNSKLPWAAGHQNNRKNLKRGLT